WRAEGGSRQICSVARRRPHRGDSQSRPDRLSPGSRLQGHRGRSSVRAAYARRLMRQVVTNPSDVPVTVLLDGGAVTIKPHAEVVVGLSPEERSLELLDEALTPQ